MTMRSLRTATVAFVATATIAPLATVATAPAAQADGWRPILGVSPGRVWFSPNKDHVSDKAKIGVGLREEATVTVKVRRLKDSTVVFKEELGNLPANFTSWTWNGKNSYGKLVRDGSYAAIFRARAAADGKTQIRATKVFVDTAYDVPKTPETSLDTVYPRTTIVRDALAVTLSGRGRLATVGRGVLKVTDAEGRVVRRVAGHAGWRRTLSVVFDGRDSADQPLPGGEYTLGFKVWDKAGNEGKSKTTTVKISGKALVEATGSLVVPPTGSMTASTTTHAGAAAVAGRDLDDRWSTTGGDDPQPYPCGATVPSEVYTNVGAMSFRSADTCSATGLAKPMAWSSGWLRLDNLTAAVAPRGLLTTKVSMRGKPTVAGETDTADLFNGGFGFSYGSTELPRGTRSPATTEESVTTVGPVTLQQPPYYSRWSNAPFASWSIATYGTDSFDVADVTVTYSYLTPES